MEYGSFKLFVMLGLGSVMVSSGISCCDGQLQEIQDNTKGALMKLKALKECPLLISSTLPYDYKEMYNETLPLTFEFDIFRFVEIDDLQQSVTIVATMEISVKLYNCGFENGSEFFFTMPKDSNQWLPLLYHDTAKEVLQIVDG